MEWVFMAAVASPAGDDGANVSWKFSRPPQIEVTRSYGDLDPFSVAFQAPDSVPVKPEPPKASTAGLPKIVSRDKSPFCECRPDYHCGCFDGQPCKCVGPPTHRVNIQDLVRGHAVSTTPSALVLSYQQQSFQPAVTQLQFYQPPQANFP